MAKASKKKTRCWPRCWPGYEPVPGKPQQSQGSCRAKAKSQLTTGEKKFRSNRERQLQRWKAAHPGSPRKAAQHLHRPGTKSASRSRPSTPRKRASR